MAPLCFRRWANTVKRKRILLLLVASCWFCVLSCSVLFCCVVSCCLFAYLVVFVVFPVCLVGGLVGSFLYIYIYSIVFCLVLSTLGLIF